MLKNYLRTELLKKYDEAALNKWFEPLDFTYPDVNNADLNIKNHMVREAQSAFTISFPHIFFYNWFKTHFKKNFEEAAKTIGVNLINYNISTDKNLETHNYLLNNTILNDGLDNKYIKNFHSFIYNQKNKFPFLAAQNFAINILDRKDPKIFIIYSASGMGKSHILSAINIEICKNVHKKDIYYSSLNELRTFLEFNKERVDTENIFTGYQAVIIDDLHQCTTDEDLQNQLASSFDSCLSHGIKCIFSLNVSPLELRLTQKKLKSILSSALAVELKRPDLDIKTRFIKAKAKELGFELKSEEIFSLAQNYTEFRQVEGILHKYSAYKASLPTDKKFALSTIMQKEWSSGTAHLTAEYIIEKTADYFKLSPAELKGGDRHKNTVQARHIAMFLCRELLGIPLSVIGNFFEDKNHSSVLYSYNKIRMLTKSNKAMNNLVTNIKNLCLK